MRISDWSSDVCSSDLLGGRLDAVNVVDPDVAVITTVDLDHQDWLGDDRELIGFEKAGIARPWKPLVLGETDPPSSVLRHAYAIGASAWRLDNDFFRSEEHTSELQSLMRISYAVFCLKKKNINKNNKQ